MYYGFCRVCMQLECVKMNLCVEDDEIETEQWLLSSFSISQFAAVNVSKPFPTIFVCISISTYLVFHYPNDSILNMLYKHTAYTLLHAYHTKQNTFTYIADISFSVVHEHAPTVQTKIDPDEMSQYLIITKCPFLVRCMVTTFQFHILFESLQNSRRHVAILRAEDQIYAAENCSWWICNSITSTRNMCDDSSWWRCLICTKYNARRKWRRMLDYILLK